MEREVLSEIRECQAVGFRYLQFLACLVDNQQLIMFNLVFHDEHAEIIAALPYPIAALILFLAEVELVSYGADALVKRPRLS